MNMQTVRYDEDTQHVLLIDKNALNQGLQSLDRLLHFSAQHNPTKAGLAKDHRYLSLLLFQFRQLEASERRAAGVGE